MTKLAELNKVHISAERTGIISALVLGVTLLVISGHLQSSALHAAAHDARHAMGFPCH